MIISHRKYRIGPDGRRTAQVLSEERGLRTMAQVLDPGEGQVLVYYEEDGRVVKGSGVILDEMMVEELWEMLGRDLEELDE